jgi:SulP family sulfate permease
VAFGATYRSNVDRPPGERTALQGLVDRVQILRLNGFVFFGTASGFLERVRKRVETVPLRFLVIDLRRVTGADSSGVLSFRKVAQLAEADGFELVFAGATEGVERQLRRGGLVASDAVRFEPDLDRALQRCEDVLLEEAAPDPVGGSTDGVTALPAHLMAYLERRSIPEGTVLIHQGDPPDDLFVLESGSLRVELASPEGERRRLSTVRPGVVVGEVALYTGTARTADVIAETPCVILGMSRAAIERLEADEPETAAALHRWLATTLSARLTDADRAYSASLD